jgi:hypothetical protein
MLNFDDKKIRASWFQMLMARIFGKKAIVDGWTFYFYKNCTYVFSGPAYDRQAQPAPSPTSEGSAE